MNIIDRIRIRKKPSIIEQWNGLKINDEIIKFAIENGYRFNAELVRRFIQYPSYFNAFKNNPQFLQTIREDALKHNGLLAFRMYSKEEFIQILKNDEELAKILLNSIKWNKDSRIEDADIIEIIQGKDELIEFVALNLSGQKICEYIASVKTPNELRSIGINLVGYGREELVESFVRCGQPEKIIELGSQILSRNDFKLDLLREQAIGNIANFYPYLDRIEELCNGNFINEEIKGITISYLLENSVMYSELVPKFALRNDEYVLFCLANSPELLLDKEFESQCNSLINSSIDFNNYPEMAKIIAQAIRDRHIKFSRIPRQYRECREIFESICIESPELLTDFYSLIRLGEITVGMSETEELDYYKSLGFKFDSNTAKYVIHNFDMVLECLKNDHMSLAQSKTMFTKEQFEEIFHVLKDEVSLEEILSSDFLKQNPYFVMHMLENGVDLKHIKIEETRYYDVLFLEFKAIAIKRGINIPAPKELESLNGVCFEGNKVVAYLNSIQSIVNGLEYIESHELDQQLVIKGMDLHNLESIKDGLEYAVEHGLADNLLITLGQNKRDEFVIADNLDYFEQLIQRGANIQFKYSSGKRVFSLEEVVDTERRFQRMTQMIKDKNLSPLEQLIAIYDITKIFKPYTHGEEDNTTDSRAFFEYLNNSYMVCVGYADLMVNLGYRLGLPVTEIGLGFEKGGVGHSRNYVHIVDEKYGIDGFYVLEPTWEQSGRAIGIYEQQRSTYKYFMLTTDEGREKSDDKISLAPNVYGGYDYFLTITTPEEFRQYLKDSRFYSDEWYDRIKVLDPDFYKTLITLDFEKDEDIQIVLDYFREKINNPVQKEKILDAVMEVKRVMNPNLSEQDLEDMRIGYSIIQPFCREVYKNPDDFFPESECLYGQDYYNEYLERRFEDIKGLTFEQAEEENVCLLLKPVITHRKKQILSNTSELGNLTSFLHIDISNPDYMRILGENIETLEELGVRYHTKAHRIVLNLDEENLTIEENFARMEEGLHHVYSLLGITRSEQERNSTHDEEEL